MSKSMNRPNKFNCYSANSTGGDAPPNTMLCGSADSPAEPLTTKLARAESAAADVRQSLSLASFWIGDIFVTIFLVFWIGFCILRYRKTKQHIERAIYLCGILASLIVFILTWLD